MLLGQRSTNNWGKQRKRGKLIIIYLFQNPKVCLKKNKFVKSWNLDVTLTEVNKQLRIPVDLLKDVLIIGDL